MRKSVDYLLISKVRVKSLKYFFFNPDKPIHLRGAVRVFSEEINAVRRELNRLNEINLLNTEKKGNRKYYSLNTQHPFYADLLSMMHKTFGLGGDLIKASNKLGDMQFAILTSSYTKGREIEPHNVDLVVVGDINLDVLGEIVHNEERKAGRELNYTVLSANDFDIRKKRRDRFVTELLMGDNILLVGDESELVAQ